MQMDKIDPLYLAHSTRVDVKDETRLKATSEEVAEWSKKVQESGSEFVSEVQDRQ
jgi:ubiquitin conjugation factor E4 B